MARARKPNSDGHGRSRVYRIVKPPPSLDPSEAIQRVTDQLESFGWSDPAGFEVLSRHPKWWKIVGWMRGPDRRGSEQPAQ